MIKRVREQKWPNRNVVAIMVLILIYLLTPSNSRAKMSSDNIATGNSSHNNNIHDEHISQDVDVATDTHISNRKALNLNTGGNTVKGNTDLGNLTTGKINIGIAVTNQVLVPHCSSCSNSTALNDSQMVKTENIATGSLSENENITTVNNNTNINKVQHTEIKNDVSVKANTGYNRVDNNTSVNNLTTGNIVVNISEESNVETVRKKEIIPVKTPNPVNAFNVAPSRLQIMLPTVPYTTNAKENTDILNVVSPRLYYLPQAGALLPVAGSIVTLLTSFILSVVVGLVTVWVRYRILHSGRLS